MDCCLSPAAARGAAKGDTVENEKSYSDLDRDVFERNYRAIHGNLPIIVQGPSSSILDHVSPNSARFVHVYASHLYPHVRVDLDSAETMLQPGGVVAFDDYRSGHTPGVAAVVWAAVAAHRLYPVCLTRSKSYGVFGDPALHQSRLRDWLARTNPLAWVENEIDGRNVVRFKPIRRAHRR